MIFVDTNVFLRFLTNDIPERAAACRALFQRLETGEEEATTSVLVFAELAYVLASPRQYRLGHAEISARLRPFFTLRGLTIPQKRLVLRSFDLFSQYPDLDFEDCYAIAQVEQQQLRAVASYDAGFDRVPGISRIDPPPAPEE